MKFQLFFAITVTIAIGLAYAGDDDKQKKIEEAEEMINQARDFLKDKQMNGHNVGEILAIRAQIGIIIAIIGELHTTNDEKALKNIYEQLEIHEKKLQDDIENFGKHSTTKSIITGNKKDERERRILLEQGYKLIDETEYYLQTHRDSYHDQHAIDRIEHELATVKSLMDQLKDIHYDEKELRAVEKRLGEHEKTLKYLINHYRMN
ncbi:uncharacterized protein LOC124489781 [Dermatophagoides farinae]|uniref:Uncharacterized protein n=1 Tax=Dermatophagoides farinae TaxID=6954 RepID=A0A922L7U9_DERFA|nr:uncharacterized protein LOC124489781 [Dermatophagoides farinae]KAH7639031.1 hypothetical protein HUG17_3064 [Dermatophagoides farinae]KAH9522548.1 hypothetical protein DERF_006112 [Dermatophagoides farinae]